MNGQRQHEWEEEPRDETTAAIYGYCHPACAPIGRCCYCGGEVWPIENTYCLSRR